MEVNLDKERVTQLLLDVSKGDRDAYDRLFPVIYDQLRQIARQQIARRPAGGAYRKTELIHEVYMKLIDNTRIDWKDRTHFYTVAAKAMRHILVDHYRKQMARKRGGSKEFVALDGDDIPIETYSEHLEALHELMDHLAKANERMHTIVNLRFFGGMTIEEIAELLNISTSTVDRDWKTARTWLYHQLNSGP